jgi:TolB protein
VCFAKGLGVRANWYNHGMSDEPSPSSYAPFIALAVVLGLFVLGLVALLVTGSIIFVLSQAMPAANSAPLQRLAVIDQDRIYTVDPDGSHPLELQHNGGVPTAALIWSRDGQRLIFVETESDTSRLISARPAGQDAITLYEDGLPRAPFYLFGSPDDRHVAFLVADALQGMKLKIADTDRASSARSAVPGQPNYSSWSPDSQSLVVHIGGTGPDAFVGTYALSNTQPVTIETSPAAFQAPFWSPTDPSQWLYARRTDSSRELVIGDGQQAKPLAEFEGGIAFSWSPDGQRVAYTVNTPSAFLYQGLTIVDLAAQTPKVYYKGNLVSFFWSPDGQQVAFLTGALVEPGRSGRVNGLAMPDAQRRTLQLTWHVLDLQTGRIGDFNTFEPTDSFIYLIQYFDQFAQSIAVWSPDSRWLVHTGQPLIGKRGVYLTDTQNPLAEPQFVGSGDFAIWSWH